MKVKFYLSLISITLFYSCSNTNNDNTSPDNNNLICTEVFITHTVEVLGDTLQTYYSIRTYNNDTIRIKTFGLSNLNYPVLNDNYTALLRNREEQIDFIAIGKSKTIREPYIFTSDGCHIIKIRGKERISF